MISNLSFTYEKNVVFATNSDILLSISVQPHVVNIFSNSEFFKIIKTNFGMSKMYFRFYKEMGGSNSKYLCIPGSTRRWVDLILKLQ